MSGKWFRPKYILTETSKHSGMDLFCVTYFLCEAKCCNTCDMNELRNEVSFSDMRFACKCKILYAIPTVICETIGMELHNLHRAVTRDNKEDKNVPDVN